MLGFFKERVDMALEDKDEAAISRIVDDGVWAIDLSVFVREPVAPLDAKAAAKLDRTSLTLECAFGDRDEGVYPSRGGAEARRSRFFGEPGSEDSPSSSPPPGYWIADEPARVHARRPRGVRVGPDFGGGERVHRRASQRARRRA